MFNKIDELCAARGRLKKEQPNPMKGKALGRRRRSILTTSQENQRLIRE
jgi:hypothetical protein